MKDRERAIYLLLVLGSVLLLVAGWNSPERGSRPPEAGARKTREEDDVRHIAV